MSSKGKKRKRSASPAPDNLASEAPRVQKLRIKPIPEIPAEGASTSGKKPSKKKKHHVSPISSTSISPQGDAGEDSGLKMKFILSPKRVKVESSPARSDTPDDASPSRGSAKGKKKDKLKAKLFFEDQVLSLDGETVTHQETPKSGKKGKSPSPRSPEIKQSPSSKKKKKDTEKGKIREESIPPFTKVPKSADRAKKKIVKTESDSGYSDTPTTSAKGKKGKAKMIIQQTIEEQPVPSPQASDVSRDSLPKSKSKSKKDKDKKKKKMFKFKGDRNRFLNVRDFSDEEGDNSLSRSLMDEDSMGATFDAQDDLSKDMDFMMPQMPVPDYNLEKQAADDYAQSMKARSGLDDGKESGEIQSGRAEDLISQLTAYGTEMETIYPSYMLAPDTKEESGSDDGWREKRFKKKKKKKFAKDKKKKKKELRVLERDEHGNAKYVMRKTKISGYMLWCRSYRPTFVSQNPGLDFSTISRRMGALWQTLDESEKKVWRKREITVNTKVPITRLTKGGKVVPAELSNDVPPFRLQQKQSEKHKSKKSKKLAAAAAVAAKKKQMAKKKNVNVKITPPRWEPIDCAAYLRLLGSSLSDVGGKLQNKFSTSLQNDDIEVHGSMSVLLDSMLCAMGPLLCLTDQVPEISSITKKSKSTMLDNIAYIMPGL